MYIGMLETRPLKILLKSFHESYCYLFIKITRYLIFFFLSVLLFNGWPAEHADHRDVVFRGSNKIYLDRKEWAPPPLASSSL